MLVQGCRGFWVVGWPAVILLLLTIFGAVGMAVYAYFFLHEDVRNVDHTRLSVRDKWRHVIALLAFFFLGGVLFGGVSLVVFRILDVL